MNEIYKARKEVHRLLFLRKEALKKGNRSSAEFYRRRANSIKNLILNKYGIIID